MKNRRICIVLTSLALLVGADWSASAADPPAESPSSRWESTIAEFEAGDKQSPPKKDGVLFIGSSSIRKWDLDESFPGAGYLNRGFGGSQIADSTYFADRIVIPYAPKVVVLYAGDNDVAKGKSPEQVAADFSAFVAKVHGSLPKTKIVFIAIKPSVARWSLVEQMRRANGMIAKTCGENELLAFVDVDRPMLTDDGRPRGELFVKDGLHLSPAGYKLWNSLVAPYLK